MIPRAPRHPSPSETGKLSAHQIPLCSSLPFQEGIGVRCTSPSRLMNCSCVQISFLQELFIALKLAAYSDGSKKKGSCKMRPQRRWNVLFVHWYQSNVDEIRLPWCFCHQSVGDRSDGSPRPEEWGLRITVLFYLTYSENFGNLRKYAGYT